MKNSDVDHGYAWVVLFCKFMFSIFNMQTLIKFVLSRFIEMLIGLNMCVFFNYSVHWSIHTPFQFSIL